MHTVDNIAISLLAKPFVVLYGPSGTGKTRAALELVLKINDQYFNYNWFNIEVNQHGRIESGNSTEFRDMVLRNERKGNNFLLSNTQDQTNITIEFCESIEFEDPTARNQFLTNTTNNLRLAANIIEEANCYKLIPVGSNWTDTKSLIGYINPFGENGQTIYEITPFIELLLLANHPENSGNPFFAILDEMNLSHVEYYLSDVLSIMETAQYATQFILSNYELNIISQTLALNPTPYNMYLLDGIQNLLNENKGLPYPTNLFIIGTINLDETTQMLSNKVLDRAHMIKINTQLPSHSLKNTTYSSEFNNEQFANKFTELISYKSSVNLNNEFENIYDSLIQKMSISSENSQNILNILDNIYLELEKIDQQYGYRITQEVFVYLITGLRFYNNSYNIKTLLNNVLIQKILVKLHGNKRILNSTLEGLNRILNTNSLSTNDISYFNPVKARLNNFNFRLDLRNHATFIS